LISRQITIFIIQTKIIHFNQLSITEAKQVIVKIVKRFFIYIAELSNSSIP